VGQHKKFNTVLITMVIQHEVMITNGDQVQILKKKDEVCVKILSWHLFRQTYCRRGGVEAAAFLRTTHRPTKIRAIHITSIIQFLMPYTYILFQHSATIVNIKHMNLQNILLTH
jgi:hypothetical protein